MKEIFLDTHSLLWFLIGSPKLSPLARSLIDDPSVQPFLSVASLWEIAIKVSLGKLVLAPPLEELISHQLAQNGIALLEIQPKHLVVVSKLPYHHRDPITRLWWGERRILGPKILRFMRIIWLAWNNRHGLRRRTPNPSPRRESSLVWWASCNPKPDLTTFRKLSNLKS